MSLKFSPAFSRSTAAILFLILCSLARTQMVDVNSNGMSDVWEWVYNATNLVATADTDGDGVINVSEATAGTDPFNSNSVPQISLLALVGTNRSITMPAALGKSYQLQSLTDLGATNWLTETSMVLRAGTSFTFPSPADSVMKFYRVVVSDVDTDGDGVNDWEEYKLGLDPSNALSNASFDTNGFAMTDYQYVTGKMSQQNVITVMATDPVTTQPDPGQAATDVGGFTFSRGGFALNALTVNFTLGGPGAGFATEGVDHVSMARSVTLPAGTLSKVLTVTPLADTNLLTPVIAQVKLSPGTKYLVGGASNASVVIYPSATANGTGLYAQYFTNASLNYASVTNFNSTNRFLTRIDTNIDFTFTNGPTPNLSNGVYSVRWTGQVIPQYSETYFFDVRSDDGVKLWVNDQLLLTNWISQGPTDWINSIPLQGGTRYNIKLEYLQNGGKGEVHLYWYSPNQAKQIIPSNRLFPTNSYSGGSNAAPTITSALSAVGFLGQPFSFTVTAANTPLGFTATNLPPGLGFNPTNGLISGTPLLAGDFQVPLTASNATSVSAAVVDIVVFDSGNAVSREVWTNVLGTNIADIPVDTAPNIAGGYGALEGITDFGDNYGERVRGYFIAPVTANYYFWIAGSDSAQLWISDDSEPVNKILRAFVTPTNNPTAPGGNGTSPRQWNLQSSQKSGWLALNAGQKYYLEILHKAGVATNDNWSVGWLQDPAGTNNTPAGVVPSYLHSRYFTPLAVNIPGTLYTANLLALPGIKSAAVGSATLRVSGDGSQAILNYSLTGIPAGQHVDHIYSDPYTIPSSQINQPSTLLFDIAAAHPQADGSYVWNIGPIPPLSAADILEIINENKCSIVIQTAGNSGEIGGHFTLANGTQVFTPPPAPPAWPDDHANTNAAVRFLTQSTFGASLAEIASVNSLGYDAWITNQFSLPVTHALPVAAANKSADPNNTWPSSDWFNTWWQNSVTAPDQLRQRVAFALSEIMVISEAGTLQDHSDGLAAYYDTLLDNSFGNFRALLKAVTLTPTMGVYLNMQGNKKGDIVAGTHANENYAREINQLFSIGLNRMWPDGSLILNSSGNLVPTYNQNVINGFAATFTGWNYFQANQGNGRLPTGFNPPVNYTNPMVLVPSSHDLNSKLVLNNVMLPPALGAAAVSNTTTNDAYCSQDLEQALDSIYNNPNVGPFICRQLIQRLVTSNPSRDYLYRVVQKFNDNGGGVRGDMSAVIKAILLDYEARSTNLLALPSYGKQREPLLRVTATARALAPPPNLAGTYAETGTQTNFITTPTPHRLNNGDTVVLNFTDTSSNTPPPSQIYSVNVINTNNFSIIVPNLLPGTYVQTNGIITNTITGHGLAAGNLVYLGFPSGGAVSGLFTVLNVISSSKFTVSTGDNSGRAGNCLLPKITAGGFVQTGTTVLVNCASPHGLAVNETFYVPTNTVSLAAGFYLVNAIPDAFHFSFTSSANVNQTQSAFDLFPLGTPALNRAGTAIVQWSTWNMSYTDNSPTYNLAQSPMSANTVFNFFFPNFEFPGALASAGLTTPEFQLTSDTGVALQMNFLQAGILYTNTTVNNTNGLSSFSSSGNGNGAVTIDIGPWMTTNYTTSANVPALVNNLNSLLLAGQLSDRARTNIISYVTNTANFVNPTNQIQMRERVRAVVHLLITSPDFTIQK